jgi:hypothetical protein
MPHGAAVTGVATGFVHIPTRIFVHIHTRIFQETNGSKLHWAALKKRHDQQKKATWLALWSAPTKTREALLNTKRWHVSIVPYGNKTMDDDGLSASCKWIRDEIARFLNVDDGDTRRVRFSYSQPEEQDTVNRYHVGVTFSPWVDKASTDEISLLARAVAAEARAATWKKAAKKFYDSLRKRAGLAERRVEELEDELDGLESELQRARHE